MHPLKERDWRALDRITGATRPIHSVNCTSLSPGIDIVGWYRLWQPMTMRLLSRGHSDIKNWKEESLSDWHWLRTISEMLRQEGFTTPMCCKLTAPTIVSLLRRVHDMDTTK